MGYPWDNIAGMPAGFADNVDDVGAGVTPGDSVNLTGLNASGTIIFSGFANCALNTTSTGQLVCGSHSAVGLTIEQIVANIGNWSGSETNVRNSILTNITNANASMKAYVDSYLSPTYYSPTQLAAIAGTIQGTLSQVNHTDGNYDSLTLNITESAGNPGLDIRFNFTDIISFNTGIMRYRTTALQGAEPIIEIWNYNDSEWEDYPNIIESTTYKVIEQSVFDMDDHLQDGIVQMRVYLAGNGNTNHVYYLDWVSIAKGAGTPSGEEVDPYTIYKTAINTTQFFYKEILQLNTSSIYSLFKSSSNISYDSATGQFSINISVGSAADTDTWNSSTDFIDTINQSVYYQIIVSEANIFDLQEYLLFDDVEECDESTEKLRWTGDGWECVLDLINDTEQMQDATLAFVAAGEGISTVYNDETNNVTISWDCNDLVDASLTCASEPEKISVTNYAQIVFAANLATNISVTNASMKSYVDAQNTYFNNSLNGFADTDTWNTTQEMIDAVNISAYFQHKIDWANVFGVAGLFQYTNSSAWYVDNGYKKENITADYPNLDTNKLDDFLIANMTTAYPNLDTNKLDDWSAGNYTASHTLASHSAFGYVTNASMNKSVDLSDVTIDTNFNITQYNITSSNPWKISYNGSCVVIQKIGGSSLSVC